MIKIICIKIKYFKINSCNWLILINLNINIICQISNIKYQYQEKSGFMNKTIYCECHEQCYALCINPKCKYPAIICEQGTINKSQCAYNHQLCNKIQWKQFSKLINQNPNKNTKEFLHIQNLIDHLFIDLISQIKSQHNNFKFWFTTYGLSIQAIDLITNINSQNLDQITGKSIFPIINELNKINNQKLIPPKIDQNQMNNIKQSIQTEFVNLAQIYLQKLKNQQNLQTLPQSIRQSHQTKQTQQNSFLKFSRNRFSKIVQNPNQLLTLFNKPIKTLKLLYRASQNNFSTKIFHQLCDTIPNTLIIVKNQFDCIFGGFTNLKWNKSKKGFQSDQSSESFMFKLNPPQKYKLTLPQFAIAHSLDNGPIFGCNDLLIVDQANINQSKSQFPICYKNQNCKRSAETSLNFCGNKIGKFIIKQWEVFEVELETEGVEEQFMKIF